MPDAIIVVDSSPLIALARIDQLVLLPQLASQILTPPAVWHEIIVRGRGLPGAYEVSQVTWLELRSPDPFLVQSLSILVDPGEAEAIALAQTLPNSLLLLDDSRARKVAERVNVKCIGTVGILLRARREGLITELRPYLEALRTHHIYVRQELIEAVLKKVGE